MGESFLQKDSLITHTLSELWLITHTLLVRNSLTHTLIDMGAIFFSFCNQFTVLMSLDISIDFQN